MLQVPHAVGEVAARAVEVLKRRGFLFPTAQIYQGLRGSYDLGPLALEIKRNLESYWWKSIVYAHPEIHGFQSPILTPAPVLKASGHLDQFSDLLVDDRLSGTRLRADKTSELQLLAVTRHGKSYQAIPITAPSTSDAKRWIETLKHSILPKGVWMERKNDTILVFVRKIMPPEVKSTTPEGLYEKIGFLELEPTLSMDSARTLHDTIGRNEPPESSNHGKTTSTASDDELPLSVPFQGYANPVNNNPFLTAPRPLNLLFKTFADAVDPVDQIINFTLSQPDSSDAGQIRSHVDRRMQSSTVYLRPETAQGVFTAFPHLVKALNLAPPFGIAQIGKAFRNEIRPEHLLFRSLEFEQMELQYFVKPEDAMRAYDQWVTKRFHWWQAMVNQKSAFRVRPHVGKELAHYAQACSDIEFQFPWGWGELEGVAHRGDYDLKQHAQASGVSMKLRDATKLADMQGQPSGGSYIPQVIESSAGLSRALLAVLFDAYSEIPTSSRAALEDEAKGGHSHRAVLKIHPYLAPVKACVVPLVGNNQDMVAYSKRVWSMLAQGTQPEGNPLAVSCAHQGLPTRLVTRHSVGRRYKEADEIGVPFCITIDERSLQYDTVTVRHRDTMDQIEIPRTEVLPRIKEFLDQWPHPF
jgi:glycyl-tRNA synthetase